MGAGGEPRVSHKRHPTASFIYLSNMPFQLVQSVMVNEAASLSLKGMWFFFFPTHRGACPFYTPRFSGSLDFCCRVSIYVKVAQCPIFNHNHRVQGLLPSEL